MIQTRVATLSPAHAAGLPALMVAGNQLIRNGQPFTLHGVNRDTLEWGRSNWGGCGGDWHRVANIYARFQEREWQYTWIARGSPFPTNAGYAAIERAIVAASGYTQL